MNDNINNTRKNITDITIFRAPGDIYKIRCRINGEFHMGAKISPDDSKTYLAILKSGEKDKLNQLKQELADKYF